MVEIRNILCPVDFSEISSKVASYAEDIARGLNAVVHVLYVAPSIDQYAVLRIPPTNFQDVVSETIIDAENTMDTFIKENFSMENVTGKVLSGYTAEMILSFSEDANIDLIIMGTHGRRGFDRVFFGSVAEKIIKAAKIPVLTIRPVL